MRAITHDGYGPPEDLQLRDVDRPNVDDRSVLVRVKAASVNPRSIGADHVVDYTVEDFTRGDRRYDLIVQVAGNQTGAELRRTLSPRGTIIVVGGGTGREPDSIGMRHLLWVTLKGRLLAPFVRQRELLIVGKITRQNLTFLATLIEQRRLTPVIERRYPLADAAEAIRVLEGGHARGKIILTIA